MWKKEDTPNPPSAPSSEAPSRTDRPSRGSSSGERATIGPSISIRGEVTGDEDLLIQGRVDGSVDLKQHAVTVGPEGKVKAGIVARVVVVEGMVEGNLKADEQVILRSSASVQGDITSPRLVLEDGARFRGGVDMGDPTERGKKGGGSGSGSSGATPSSGASSSSPSSSGSSSGSGGSGSTSSGKGSGSDTSSSPGGSSGKGKESAAAAGSRG
jgi:cytoskeletal protein CcmA (bactofilin family)